MSQDRTSRTPPPTGHGIHDDLENVPVSPRLSSPKRFREDRKPQKRGPSTPLTTMNKQNNVIRRRIEESTRRKEVLSFGREQNTDIIDLNYRNWVLNQDLKKHQEIIQFMELERKFTLEK